MRRSFLTSNYLWLAIGCVLLLFAGGKWNVPIATWLAPVAVLETERASQGGVR